MGGLPLHRLRSTERSWLISALVLCSLLSFGCANPPRFYTPLSAAGTVLVNGSPFNSADRIYPGDSIETGRSSCLYLRLDAKSYLVAYPETVFTCGKDASRFSFSLEKGAVYIYGMDGRRLAVSAGGAEYSASGKMRGWFYREGDGSGIRLSAGEAELTVGGKRSDLTLRPGFGTDVAGAKVSSVSPLDQTMIDELILLEKAVERGAGDSFLSEKVRLTLFSYSGTSLAGAVELRKLSMESGPLSTVTTKKKKSWVGAVTARGKYIEVRTVSGVEKIPSSEVLTVSRYHFQ